ncbi:MAG: protein kinase [Ktedonobacteraceae bacterium]|nr:protein kinase [Ktedonobacteraceae bacterium]
MATDNRDLVGSILGECRLERLIGRGGMSSVYLGKQTRPARYVAVKVLGSQLSSSTIREDYQTFLIRFRREADIVAKLEHVNIIPLYAYGEENQFAYIIMPYISGGSLSDVIREKHKLSLQQTLIYLQQAASALDYAHARNVVHRDLKPSNFLLYPQDNRLVLADFGIARIAAESPYATQETTLTQAGAAPGTLGYMAPEMLRDAKNVDYRVDIYALGIVLYQMLSGELPFKGDLYAVINKHLSEPLPLLHQRDSAIPADVDDVLRKATAKVREQRYSSASELAQDFHRAINGASGETTLGSRPSSWNDPSGQPSSSVPASPWNTPTPPAQSAYSSPAFQDGSPGVAHPTPVRDSSRNAAGNAYTDTPWNDMTAQGRHTSYSPQQGYQDTRLPNSVASPPAYQPAQGYLTNMPAPTKMADTPRYTIPARRRRRSPWGGLIFLLLLLLVGAGLLSFWTTHRNPGVTLTPTSTPLTPTGRAKQVIQEYYADVNNRDYKSAYDLLTPGFQSSLGSYDSFVRGYQNTKHDDISFGAARQVSSGNVDVVTTLRALEARPQGDVTTTYHLRYRVVYLNGSWKIQSGVVV